MKSQGLLKTLNQCEYPAEFLAARLLGKKGALFRTWEFLITGSDPVANLRHTTFYPFLKKSGPPGIWNFLHEEHLWVYKRMNNKLRVQFEVYFVYHEIRTLIVCLRYVSSGRESGIVSQVMAKSLLHRDIHDILTSNLDFSLLLQALESRFCSYSRLFSGMQASFKKKGMSGLESFVRNCFFAVFLSRKPPAMLRRFLQYLIDYHNCISMSKALRWQTGTEPIMLAGGTVPTHRFTGAYLNRDMAPVLKFLHLRDADAVATSMPKLENALLCFISRKLKGWSLQRTMTGEILLYLWEQYRYARNISMVLNTMHLDDEPVRESIVA